MSPQDPSKTPWGQPWSSAIRKAERELAKNRRLIESTIKGTPSGRDHSLHTRDDWGYFVTKSLGGRCEICGKTVKKGTRARWRPGVGIRHSRCHPETVGSPQRRRSVHQSA